MNDEQIKTDPDIVVRLRYTHVEDTMQEAAAEIERLRALINEWADADTEANQVHVPPLSIDNEQGLAIVRRYQKAVDALRRAVGR